MSKSDGPPASAAESELGVPSQETTPTRSSPSGRRTGRSVACAGAAAILVWLVTVAAGFPFFVGPVVEATGGPGVSRPSAEELAQMARRGYLNSAAMVALSSAVVGVALALGDGLGRQMMPRVLISIFGACILGGVGGTAGGLAAQWLLDFPRLHAFAGLRIPFIHGVCWGLAGLGIGIGVMLTDFGRAASSIGGALGGAVSALVFAAISAVVGILNPVGETSGLVPDSTADRLLWLLTAAISIALGVSGLTRPAGSGGTGAGARGQGKALLAISAIGLLFASAWTGVLFASHAVAGLDQAPPSVSATFDGPAAAVGEFFPQVDATGWLNRAPADGADDTKLLVVDVWDARCSSCRGAAPCLLDAYERFHDRGVEFIGLTVNRQDMARGFVAQAGFTWPVGYEATTTLNALGSLAPTVYILNRDGRIVWTDERSRYAHDPMRLRRELAPAIEAALEQATSIVQTSAH